MDPLAPGRFLFGRFNILQTWHGSPIKKIGIDAILDANKSFSSLVKVNVLRREFGNYIGILSSSREEAVGKTKNEQTNQDFSDIFVAVLKEAPKKSKKKKDPKNHMPDWDTPTNGFDKDFEGETYGIEELN